MAMKNLQIKNPKTLQVVREEWDLGGGRSASETAENLIAEAVAARQVKRALAKDARTTPRASNREEAA